MKYNLDGKEIRIPDEEIKRYVETMHITEEEAIQIYLEDEGYLENEEQEKDAEDYQEQAEDMTDSDNDFELSSGGSVESNPFKDTLDTEQPEEKPTPNNIEKPELAPQVDLANIEGEDLL